MQLSIGKLPHESIHLPAGPNSYVTYLKVACPGWLSSGFPVSFGLRPPLSLTCFSPVFSSSTAQGLPVQPLFSHKSVPQRAIVFESWSWPSTHSSLWAIWVRSGWPGREPVQKPFLGCSKKSEVRALREENWFPSLHSFKIPPAFPTVLFSHEKELLFKPENVLKDCQGAPVG